MNLKRAMSVLNAIDVLWVLQDISNCMLII